MKTNRAFPIIASSVCLFLMVASPSSHGAVTLFTFLNGMTGANEVGPNASTATATITTLQFDDSVGAFGTLSINVAFSGLAAPASAAHLHGFTGVGVNAGVIQGLTVSLATSGTITGSWAPTSTAQVTNLHSGLTYLNLHSAAFVGGEIRGQLIPEPGVFGLLGMTGLALLRRRSRRTV